MNAFVSRSFYTPVVIMQERGDSTNFTPVDELFQVAQEKSFENPCAAGSLLIYNDSHVTITCNSTEIRPRASVLFARLFTRTEPDRFLEGHSSQTIKFKSALLLEANLDMVLSGDGCDISSGFNRTVTVKSAGDDAVSILIDQFNSYVPNKELLELRKRANPEFSRFCSDPEKYIQDVKKRDVFVIQTRTHSTFTSKPLSPELLEARSARLDKLHADLREKYLKRLKNLRHANSWL